MGSSIWGGVNSRFESLPNEKLYNTRTGVWRTISGTYAPTPRLNATSVWSGKEFIGWGGSDAAGNPIGTGAKYNPTTNTWTPITTTGAPVPAFESHRDLGRFSHDHLARLR